jgi:ferredoxin
MRIDVDLSRCQGYGNCLGAAPAVFDLGDNGLVILLDGEPASEQHEAVRKAAKLCPVAAIALTEDDGAA